MDSLTYLQLLRRNHSFRRIWVGQVISELGNWFNFIAALGLMRVVSHASPEVTTIMLVLRLAPFVLFASLAGAFVDRWSRRTVMIVTDLARVVVALGFLLVRRPEDLWIGYVCMGLLSFFGTFFEAAKNAAVPNITGERDLLAGNALMFSSRFLLMSLGAALGGWTSALVGYQAAFVINAISFLASAYSVWLVPEEQTRQAPTAVASRAGRHRGYWRDIREGWSYIIAHAPVATILAINIIWAVGGGTINLVVDRLGALVFVGQYGMSADAAIAAFYVANGFGLTLGMMIARRVGNYVESSGRIVGFIGWSLFIQGFFFAFMGMTTNLWLACAFLFASRVILGAEFAVQDTLLMRLVPDKLRGRVSITDRAAEILVWTFSTAAGGWLLYSITPRSLTVWSGLLSGVSGIVWLVLFAARAVRLPKRFTGQLPSAESNVTATD